MRSKLSPEQSFWRDLASKFDEKAAVEEVDRAIAQQRRAITLAGRVLTLRNMPGFAEFQSALEDIRDHTASQLASTTSSNDHMRVLQGQVQAYNNLLGVMRRGEQRVQALEKALEDLQNQKRLLERPTTKPEAQK